MAPGLPSGFSNVSNGQATMTGAAVQLPDDLASEVVITALKGNAAPIYVGGPGVTTSSGLELAPGASVTVHLGHTDMLFAIGNSGDKLSFLAAF